MRLNTALDVGVPRAVEGRGQHYHYLCICLVLQVQQALLDLQISLCCYPNEAKHQTT